MVMRNGLSFCAAFLICMHVVAQAQDNAELAKQLANPVASLISVPFQSNFDFNIGPSDDGFRYTLNIQPVVPISLNQDWNLISPTLSHLHHPICLEFRVANGSHVRLGR